MSILVNNPLRRSYKEIEKRAEYRTVTDAKTFIEAEKRLSDWEYYGSVTAEKRRFVNHKRILKIDPSDTYNLFDKLIIQFISVVSKQQLSIEDFGKTTFIAAKGDGSIRKLHKYEKGNILQVRWIDYDSVYNFVIEIRRKLNRDGEVKRAKLVIMYNVKLPVTMDYWSLQGLTGRMDFKANFRDLIKNLKKSLKEQGYM